MATPPIVDADTRNDYTASGGQTVFSYTFWAKAETDLDVYVNNVLQTLTTDYTVSGVQNANGGDITFTSGLTNGDEVAIVYNPDVERQTNFETSGQFTADAMNLELDYHTSVMQWIKTKLSRTLQVADGVETSAALTVDAPDDNANKFLRVNASGTGYDYVNIADSSVVSNFETQLFSGTGVLDTFTLTAFTPLDADQIEVVVDNATQYPVSDYTISGNDIIFESGSIPASGTDNIFVRNLANGSLTTTPADSSVSTAKIQANAVTAAKIDSDFVADYTDTTIAATDLILFGDVSDASITKRDTVQGIVDLVPADLFGKADATIALTDKIAFSDTSDGGNPKTDTVQGIVDLVPDPITLLTEQATTSGTSFDFTVPSGVKKVNVLFSGGVSLSGTDHILVQLNSETSGYVSRGENTGGGATTSTAGFVIFMGNATRAMRGVLTIHLEDESAFTWVAGGVMQSDANILLTSGDKSLASELTTITITRTGTNTFDGGSVNVSYEM